MTRSDETRRALVTELEKHGIADYRFEMGGKHGKLFFKAPGHKERFYVFAGTPSDKRSLKNSIADLRKMLGPKPKAKKSTKPKRVKSKARKPIAAEPLAPRPLHPFDPLNEYRRRVFDHEIARLAEATDNSILAQFQTAHLPPIKYGPWVRLINRMRLTFNKLRRTA